MTTQQSLVSLSPSSPLRAASYLRVSTDQQVERYGLESQRAACQQYATARQYQLVAEYLEGDGQRGVSGGKTDRPTINRLLRDAKQRPRRFERVIIYDTSRLGRDDWSWYAGWVENQLAEQGILVEYVREQFAHDPASQLQKQLLRGVNAFQKQMTAIRDREGIVARAKAGKWPGGMPPLGYDVMEERLVVNPEEAQVVEQIFHLYTERQLTCGEIARRLFEAGLPNKWTRLGAKHTRYQSSWTASGIYRLLENRVYTGQFVWGRKKNPRHQTWLSNEQVLMPCPAIISEAIWAAAQQQMAVNRHHGHRDKKHPYLVSGVLHCAVCGWAMRGMPTKRAGLQYYFCNPSERSGHTFCYNRARFRVTAVDAAVWDVLVQGLQDPSRLYTALERQLGTEDTTTQAQLHSVQEQLVTLERKGAEVLQLDTSTPFARDQVARLLADLDRQRDTLHQEQHRLQAALSGEPAAGAGRAQLEQVRRWLLATPVTAGDEGTLDPLPPAVAGTVAGLAAPLSEEQQAWLFRLRQRIVRDLKVSVTVQPDGSGAVQIQDDPRSLPLQVPALPPKKPAKSK